jgi:hypothetical protein
MIDCISELENSQPRREFRYLTPHPAEFKNYQTCPWAKTLVVEDIETGRPNVRSVTCKRWGCSYCAPRKIRKLAFLTNGAMPNRWIRLGVKPDLYKDGKEAWLKTTAKLPELCRVLRKEIGECEYLRVCELHQSGMPHYHAMLRSGFIPQKRMSTIWGDLTGAPVVYIAKIDQTFSSFRYLTKYLTKLHRIEWTDRHVSYSRNFFRPEDLEKMAYPKRDVLAKSDDHPWKWMADRYAWEQVEVEQDGSWTLPPTNDSDLRELAEKSQDWSLSDFGLALPETPETPASIEQQKMFDTSPLPF